MTKNTINREKLTHKNRFKSRHYTFLICLVLCVTILLPMISGFEFDNIKEIKDTKGWKDYNNIKIKNCDIWLGVCLNEGEDLWEGSLKYNTDSCGDSCEARTDVTLHKDGSLVDEIIFRDTNGLEQNIKDYQFYIKTGVTEIDVPEYQCNPDGYYKNGTEIITCGNVLVKQDREDWKEYELGEELLAGDYTLKLTGEKEYEETVDWVIKVQGEWLDEWALWVGDYAVWSGCTHFYTLNSTTADVTGWGDNLAGSTNYTTGLLGNGNGFNDGIGPIYDTAMHAGYPTGDEERSTSVWFYATHHGTGGMFGMGNIGATRSTLIPYYDSGTITIMTKDDDGTLTSGVTLDTWHHVVFTYETSTNKIVGYYDGVNVANHTLSGNLNTNDDLRVGTTDGGAEFDGVIDELGFWNKSLTADEVSSLYNAGVGLSYGQPAGDVTPPTVTIDVPQNISYYDTSIFSVIATDDEQVDNCSYSLNSAANVTMTNVTSNYTDTNSSLANGNYLFEIFCRDTNNNINTPTSISFTRASKVVNIVYPTNTTYSTNILDIKYTSNADDSCLYSLDDGITNSSHVSVGTNWTGITMNEGNDKVTVYCNDSTSPLASGVQHFTVDTTEPNVVLTAPINTTYLSGLMTANSTKIIINWTWNSDMETCWYTNGNGSNSYKTCSDNGTIYNDTFYHYNITLFSNDSVSNENSSSISATWKYPVYENSQRFNDTTNEMLDEDFEIDLIYDSSFTASSASFVYNGTQYIGTKVGSGYNINFTYLNFPIPITNITNPVNLTFYWDILLTNSSGSYHFNSTKKEQQITETSMYVCNATYPTRYVNFTINREDTRAIQGADVKASFFYSLGTAFTRKNLSMTVNNRSFGLCPNVNGTFIMSSIINLQNESYNERTYEFIDRTYTSTVTNTDLFMLSSGNGTVIIIQIKDSGLVPLEDYVVEVKRYYPSDNTYEIVESSPTDEYGQTVSTRLVENTIDYIFIIKNTEGVVVKQTGRMRINCAASPCFQRFIIEDDTDYYDIIKTDIDDFTGTLTWINATNTFTYVWNDVSGDIVTQRLLVNRYNWNGTTTVCNETSISTTGSFTCDVGDSRSDYIASALRRVSGKTETVVATLSSSVLASGWATFGWSGLFWSFFFLMTCVSIGYWKPTVGFTLYGVGIILLNVMDIISLNPAVLIAHAVIIAIAIWAWRG